MSVVLKTTMAGPTGVSHPGERLELGAALERDLVERGFADFVKQQGKAETARRRAPETAALQHLSRPSQE